MTRRLPLLVVLLTTAWGCRCGGESSSGRVDAGMARTVPLEEDLPLPSRDDHGLPDEVGMQVLARVDGRPLTVVDYLDDYERLRGADRVRFAMPRQRAELLERRIREELLADEARRRGYDDEPSVRAAREAAMRRVLVEDIRRDLATVPTESELLGLYAEEPERWHRPSRVRIEYARGTRVEAEAALARARAHREPLRALREWAAASTSPTVGNGQLGPFAHPSTGWRDAMSVPRAVAVVAHATTPGTLHPEVVEADGAFYVVYSLVAEAETRISFEEAREELVRLHAERAFERALALALPDAEPTIDEGALAAVRRP